MNPHQVASENYPQVVHDAPHGVGHIVPFRILAGVFAALTILTVITVAASYVNFGEFNLIIAARPLRWSRRRWWCCFSCICGGTSRSIRSCSSAA